jgi:DNA-binding PucR family transcriptional regulator
MVPPRGEGCAKGRAAAYRGLGDIAMTDTTITLDQTEEEMMAYEVSDETLETAAGTGSKGANYTLFYCTALDLCPGP